MKKNNNHIVNRVNLEINTPNKDKAFELKNKIDSFLKDRLFPELELLFNEISSPGQIRRFETIQLEFEMQHAEDLDFMAAKFAEQIRTKLAEIGYQNDDTDQNNANYGYPVNQNFLTSGNGYQTSEFADRTTISPYTNLKNTVIYFLETGHLPWYAIPELFEEFMQPIHFEKTLNDPAFVEQLKKLFVTRPESLTRLACQFSKQIIEKLIITLSKSLRLPEAIHLKSEKPELQSLVYEWIIARLINSTSQLFSEKREKLRLALLDVPDQNISIEQLENRVTDILSEIGFGNPEQTTSVRLSKPEPGEKKQIADEIYIRNAGLILAHPFLKELFKRANCLENRDQIRKGKQDYAVHLLHFVCTGIEQPVEYELVFEKLLCGLSLNQPVSRNIVLQEKDKAECADLLKSVIENWTALKNTSPDGLRQNFFLRNGKIDLRQSPVKLYVERNVIDVLLEKLPWSVSAVKLPWMSDLIFVEW